MQRPAAIAGTAIFFVLVPCVFAGWIPWRITGWEFRAPFLGLEPTRYVGALLILAGVPGLIDSFTQFAVKGLGTPAPIAPTQNLVLSGLYRYVRNPMYIAVVSVVFGQALLFGDPRLLLYGAVFWLICHLFVIFYEEPTLKRTFGAQYDSFRANVPRWIPRLTPWNGSAL